MVSLVCPLCGRLYRSQARRALRNARLALNQHLVFRHAELGNRQRSLLADTAVRGGCQ